MRAMVTFLLALSLGGSACAADVQALKADHNTVTTQELIKVERAIDDAFKSGDGPALAAFLSDDYLYTGEDGKVADKRRFLAEAAKIKVGAYALSEVVAHSYGDTGIVTGLWRGKVSSDGNENEVALHFTDTFVRRDHRWWNVAGAVTRVSGDAGAE